MQSADEPDTSGSPACVVPAISPHAWSGSRFVGVKRCQIPVGRESGLSACAMPYAADNSTGCRELSCLRRVGCVFQTLCSPAGLREDFAATTYPARCTDRASKPFVRLLECRTTPMSGAVAQLGERCVRNAEVGGSSPLRSTCRKHFPILDLAACQVVRKRGGKTLKSGTPYRFSRCTPFQGRHVMPHSKTGTPPKYRHHKARNLAEVTIARRDI